MWEKGITLSLLLTNMIKQMSIHDVVGHRRPQELDGPQTAMDILLAAAEFHDRLAVAKQDGIYRGRYNRSEMVHLIQIQ